MKCECDPLAGYFPAPAALVLTGQRCVCSSSAVWNELSKTCDCNYKIGFVRVGTGCVRCSSITNSSGYASPNGCSCIPGYRWQSSTGTCAGCSSGFYSKAELCLSCTDSLPNGATLAGCQSCSNAEGFVLVGGVCMVCTSK